jgi:flagellar hook assembly protein FlgD
VRRAAAAVARFEPAPPAAAMTTAPAIVTRAQWGADESLRSGTPDYAPVKMAFVHHTAGGNDYTRAEAAAVVRGAYYYHTKSLHWSDIGYNFLIDRFGTIYEGRYGGISKGVIGAQVLGFNTGSTGVSLMGNYVDKAPPSAAIASLKKLLAWKLDVHHVDPLGTATLVCGYGQKFATGEHVRFNAISGHRDANFTACPGRVYGLLPAIRTAVAKIGLPKIYGASVSPAAVSPNGDGVKDKVSVGFTVSEPAGWRVEVKDGDGDVLRHFEGNGAAAELAWGGNDDAGHAVPDGAYKVVVSAASATGEARPATYPVVIDRVPPAITAVTAAPDPFSPNGDGHSDLTGLSFASGEPGSARLSVLDGGGAVVRTVTGWEAVAAGAQRLSWDGRVSADGGLTTAVDGRYTLLVELRDRAGNGADARHAVTADRTLGFPTVQPRISSPNGDGVRDTLTYGFKLTRRAAVVVAVMRGDSVLKTLRPGTLSAGAQSVTWDGVLGSGERVTSGVYRCRVRAESTIGVVAVSEPFVVDRYSPRLTVPATLTATLGTAARVGFTVRDPYSPTVRVKVVVTDAAGTQVATIDCGWVKQAVAQVFRWKAAKRGAYKLTFTAVDRGGNHQGGTVRTALTVR